MDLASGLSVEVASLSIEGGPLQPDGEYGHADNSGQGVGFFNNYFSGAGRLVIDTTSPYDDWAATFAGFTGANTEPEENFDNDGIDNLLEFVLGGDPTISDPIIAPSVMSAAGSNFEFSFQRSDDSAL